MPPRSPLLLVGAGPAGTSAALWLKDLQIPFDWVEASDQIGGTLHQVHNPIPQDIAQRWDNGQALIQAMQRRLEQAHLAPQLQTRVTALQAQTLGEPLEVALEQAQGRAWRDTWRVVILATGTRRRSLGLPQEAQHRGRGVATSGRAERHRFQGKDVAIVGGGDAALENALLLAEVARSVTVIHRSQRFRARAEFLEPARQHPRVRFLTQATLEAIHAADPRAPLLDAITIRHQGQRQRLEIQGLLVRIGVMASLPEAYLGDHPLQTWGGGYLHLDPQGRSQHPAVLGAGDCACPDFRAVATAVGQGARAARTAAALLKAP